jgi:hypothetical protein
LSAFSVVILEVNSRVFEAAALSGSICGGGEDRKLRKGVTRVYLLQLELPSSKCFLGHAVHSKHSRIGADLRFQKAFVGESL